MARISPFKCPRHGVPLERRVVELSRTGTVLSGLSTVAFWQCPAVVPHAARKLGVNPDGRCNFCKPDKWGPKVRKRGN